MIVIASLIGVIGTYLVIGFALSVLVYAGLHNEWSTFIRYEPDEKRFDDDEIKKLSDLTFWFWPVVILMLLFFQMKNLRDNLGRKLRK